MINVPDYKILKKIGSGGMGDVYLAEHEILGHKVAIKSLHNNLVRDKNFILRFKTEARILTTLDHPNIVRILDFKEKENGLFIIMEFVEGQQLDEYINKVTGPIVEKDLIPLFKQMLEAIAFAHAKGLVHRDIKPSNVIISDGKIKILDFGIAKDLSEDSGLTNTGVQIGTVYYMSPEQVNAEKIDKLTDIYSLGVTLFYMAVGKPPYENSNAFKIGIKIISETFPEAKNFYPGVSEKIERIISKATQKKKKDRYQSCEEFKKDLSSPLKIVSQKNIPKPEKTRNPKPKKKSNLKPEKTRNLKKVSLILFLVALLSLGIGYLVVFYDPPPPPASAAVLYGGELISDGVFENDERVYKNYSKNLSWNEWDFPKWTNVITKHYNIDFNDHTELQNFKYKNEEINIKSLKSRWYSHNPQKPFFSSGDQIYINLSDISNLRIELSKEYDKMQLAAKAEEVKRVKADEEARVKAEEEARGKEQNKEKFKSETSYYNRGVDNYNNANYNAAITDFTKAINLDPNEALYYDFRGASYNELEYYNKSITDYTKAINLDPNKASYYNWRAVSYFSLEYFNAAITDFTKAINLDPNEALYYVNRGDAHYELGKYNDAIDDFGRGINLDPNDDDYYNRRGKVYYMSESYNAAIKDFTKAINLDPNNGAYYYNRASSKELLNLFYCNDYRMGCVLGHTDSCEIYEEDCQ
jgi:serine/threonine protein kinase/Flp pilus assembly protein TadD